MFGKLSPSVPFPILYLVCSPVFQYSIGSSYLMLTQYGLWSCCVALLFLQEAIQLDGEILFSLLQKVSPVAHKHLSRQKIDPLLYMTEWFMCAFARTLPWSSVLRVWDMFFCEGIGQCWIVGGAKEAHKPPLDSSPAPYRRQDYLPCGAGTAEACTRLS